MGPFSSSRENKYILVVVDYVSKWMEIIACQMVDVNVIKYFFNKIIFSWFRVSRIVISDKWKNFINKQLTTS
jgi:hypothetical protein